MICTICSAMKEKILSMPNISLSFINGSTNYQVSALKDHDASMCHNKAVREKEHEEAVAVGQSVPPRKVVQQAPSDSSIIQGINHMGNLERESVKKLQEIAYYIALKGQPFSNFKEQVEQEQLHGVKYSGAYENDIACKDFIFSIAEYFFEEDTRNKLESVNFLAVLCDGSTDTSIIEQEVVYVIYTDPETHLPVLKFFRVVAPSVSQDAPGLKQAIIAAFKENSLESALEKIVFLSSDGASVNCGKNSGLIRQFQEDYPWISFIWCFSHRLELALKDALKEFMEPVDTTLTHLYYLYTKSSKKHRELKNLYELLKGEFEMFSSGVRPVKATGTRWIDHKLRAMDRVVEKFGLYCAHLSNTISTTTNSKDRSTLEGKFDKLVDAKVLLRCALFTDILAEAKKFSLITQKSDINIIGVLDLVESTKNNYERLFRKLSKNRNYVFQLPTLKSVIDAIESNDEDGEAMYQDQKVNYYIREKKYIENHALDMVQAIISCFEKRYGNLYSNDTEAAVNVNSDHGDRILLDICQILNCNIWPKNQTSNEKEFVVQLNAFRNVFDRYSGMEIFKEFIKEDVTESFMALTNYAYRYFDISNIKPMEFWSKMLNLHKHNTSWKVALLIVELCFCAPISNATLERLFSQMNLIKTTHRNRLSNDSLNSILRIRISGISVLTFHNVYADKCVQYWYNSKNRRLQQKKRKGYKKRAKKPKRQKFDISKLSSSSSDSSSTSESE